MGMGDHELKRTCETSSFESDIDNGTCVTCNCTVTWDEASQDDEVCIRTKPRCTKSVDEHVDWRASCLHSTRCAVELEHQLSALRAQLTNWQRVAEEQSKALEQAVRERDEARASSPSIKTRATMNGRRLTLDEIEAKAKQSIAISECLELNDDLARFTLRVLPVIRQAETWCDLAIDGDRTGQDDRTLERVITAARRTEG